MMCTDDIINMRRFGAGIENDGRFWNEHDKKALIDDFEAGVGLTEIAQKLKRSETAIVQQLVQEHMFDNETSKRPGKRPKSSAPPNCLCSQCKDHELCESAPPSDGRPCYVKEGVDDKHV